MSIVRVASSFDAGKWWPRRLTRAAYLAAALALCAAPAPNASAQFVKLADFDTLVPGGSFFEVLPGIFPAGTDKFNGFAAPGISGPSVVFVGNASGLPTMELTGIFQAPASGGAVQELVTRRTWLPEYTGPRSGPRAPNNAGEGVFFSFNAALMEVKAGRVAFAASTLPSFGVQEINGNVYLVDLFGGRPQHLLRAKDSRSPSGNYEPITNVLLGTPNSAVVHAGSPAGLYQRSVLGNTTIVDSNMPIPGGSANFFISNFVEHAAYDGGVAFVSHAPTSGNAIWLKNATATDFVMLRRSDLGAAASDAPFALVTFHQLRADTSGALTFLGASAGSTQSGIFTQRTASHVPRENFSVIATTSTPAPSGTGNFTAFTRIAASSRTERVGASGPTYLETDVVFTARDRANQSAIYVYADDQITTFGSGARLQRVIGVGDTLDGKTVSGVAIGKNAISDHRIAFHAAFTDGTQGIFTAPTQGFLPRSGVAVSTNAAIGPHGAPTMEDDATTSGTTSALGVSGVSDGPGRSANASGDGLASPITGGVRVRARAYSEGLSLSRASTEVIATQRFIVLGATTGLEVDVDFNFSFSGLLGTSLTGALARVEISALAFQVGSAPIELFDGRLSLSLGVLNREGAYGDPGSLGDVLNALDPFGDGRPAEGVSILSVREFDDVLRAHVGETLAVQYRIFAYAEGSSAIADFSRTFDAFASTTTEGASLAMIHAVPIPEPAQVVLMLCGIALLLVRIGSAQRPAS